MDFLTVAQFMHLDTQCKISGSVCGRLPLPVCPCCAWHARRQDDDVGEVLAHAHGDPAKVLYMR